MPMYYANINVNVKLHVICNACIGYLFFIGHYGVIEQSVALSKSKTHLYKLIYAKVSLYKPLMHLLYQRYDNLVLAKVFCRYGNWIQVKVLLKAGNLIIST